MTNCCVLNALSLASEFDTKIISVEECPEDKNTVFVKSLEAQSSQQSTIEALLNNDNQDVAVIKKSATAFKSPENHQQQTDKLTLQFVFLIFLQPS